MRADVTCPQSPPVNKEIVIAIQGGGLHALPMLGQARAFLDAGYTPVGFAGNSAGAILAALLWCGLRPERIETALGDMLGDGPGGLTHLLRPTGDEAAREDGAVGRLRGVTDRIRGLFPLPAMGFRHPLSTLQFLKRLSGLRDDLLPPWRLRGAFDGNRLAELIDRLLKEGLGLSGPSMVRFRDVKTNRPPLLMTITNVSHGRLEVISSADPAFADVEIARAVRASSSFPGFFQPLDLPGMREGRCFVDGGLISNFPLWAFSANYRERLQQSARFGWFAPRPWIPVGLRVRDEEADAVEVDDPSAYAVRLALIAMGMARNDLEDRLVEETYPNTLTVVQPVSSLPVDATTGKPIGFLDVGALTKAKLAEMVKSGEAAANKVLASKAHRQVYDPGCGPKVLTFLEDLLRRCEFAMRAEPGDLKLRANVFIPVQSRMEMRFGVRMGDYLDDGRCFETLDEGLTGICYQRRTAAICNLEEVAKIAEKGDTGLSPYNMDRRSHALVDPGRTWLISYPVFDPAERRPLRKASQASHQAYTPLMRLLPTEHTGPILGVLNVDAAWDYDKLRLERSPDMHVLDDRVVAVADVVAQASLGLARILVGMEKLS